MRLSAFARSIDQLSPHDVSTAGKYGLCIYGFKPYSTFENWYWSLKPKYKYTHIDLYKTSMDIRKRKEKSET